MKINSIKLSNIGPFVSANTIDFSTSSGKNIVLIGGKNGSGKTTILKALKYGLFGCFAMGLKQESYAYYKEIQTILNSKSKADFFIEISIEIVEDFESNIYVIKRSWQKDNGSITESHLVTLNGTILPIAHTDEFFNKLKARTSPQLINSFMFDGEKISNIIENNEVSEYLRSVFNSIFNVDLIVQTQKDLSTYLSKKIEAEGSNLQAEVIQLTNLLDSAKEKERSYKSQVEKLQQAKKELLTLHRSSFDKFCRTAGINPSKRSELIVKLNDMSKEREFINKEVRSYIEDTLPIYMNLDLLQNALEVAQLEQVANYPQQLQEIADYMKKDVSALKDELANMVKNVRVLHDLTKSKINLIEERLGHLKINTDKIIDCLVNKVSAEERREEVKDIITEDEMFGKLNIIVETNHELESNMQNIDKQIAELTSLSLATVKELEINLELYERKYNEVKKKFTHDKSFLLADKCQDVCYDFINKLTSRKLSLVASTALGIFKDTIRKKNYITKIEINNQFELKLYDNKGKYFDVKHLSAGETQILVSSLIWGMFKVSNRREMFVFDTPLARLDFENRENFISNIISTISSQVVILSTDSEFVGNNLNLVNDRIYKNYLLEYNAATASSSITNNYFER